MMNIIAFSRMSSWMLGTHWSDWSFTWAIVIWLDFLWWKDKHLTDRKAAGRPGDSTRRERWRKSYWNSYHHREFLRGKKASPSFHGSLLGRSLPQQRKQKTHNIFLSHHSYKQWNTCCDTEVNDNISPFYDKVSPGHSFSTTVSANSFSFSFLSFSFFFQKKAHRHRE